VTTERPATLQPGDVVGGARTPDLRRVERAIVRGLADEFGKGWQFQVTLPDSFSIAITGTNVVIDVREGRRVHAPWCSYAHDGPCPAENGLAPPPPAPAAALTVDESEWLESAARRGATDTIVPGAAECLVALADKLAAARGTAIRPNRPEAALKAALGNGEQETPDA
jgi:hypothetical protein